MKIKKTTKTLTLLIFVFVLFLLFGKSALAPEFFSKFSIKKVDPEARILVVGDLMFDRFIRHKAEQNGNDYIFSCIKDDLLAFDSVLANLEGPITENISKSLGAGVGEPGNTRFTFPVSLPKTLAKHNIKIVSLANNHMRDFGQDGIESTKSILLSSNISYFGNEPKALIKNINNVDIVFIGYDEWFLSAEDVLTEIRQYAGKYPIIVYAHWGDEYVPASDRVKILARKFVDAGANIVIGSHPHVIQENEIYKNVPIYYSLGNFIFDQYFSDEVKTGLALDITISKEGIKNISQIILDIKTDGRTCFEKV